MRPQAFLGPEGPNETGSRLRARTAGAALAASAVWHVTGLAGSGIQSAVTCRTRCPFFQARQHLGEGDTQSGRNLHQIGEAEVGLAAFDRPHESAMDAAEIGERLLGIPTLEPQLSDSLPQYTKDILHLHESGSTLVYASTVFA